ncbi:hypothetical protein F5148DRAFT_1245421, partial [Russula earlei]
MIFKQMFRKGTNIPSHLTPQTKYPIDYMHFMTTCQRLVEADGLLKEASQRLEEHRNTIDLENYVMAQGLLTMYVILYGSLDLRLTTTSLEVREIIELVWRTRICLADTSRHRRTSTKPKKPTKGLSNSSRVYIQVSLLVRALFGFHPFGCCGVIVC